MLTATLTIMSVDADTIATSLRPEAGRELPRTQIKVHGSKDVAKVEISATDTSAMRAALNSYLECVRITEDIGKIIR